MNKSEIRGIFEPWWEEQIAALDDIFDVKIDDAIDWVLEYLQGFRSADDYDDYVKRIVNKCTLAVRAKSNGAGKLQQTQCIALVVSLLAVFMDLINDEKLSNASSHLQTIMEGKFVSTYAAFSSMLPYLKDRILDLQKALQVIWDGDRETDRDSDCFPLGFLSLEKVKELYLILRDCSIIDEAVSENVFYKLFGCVRNDNPIEPIMWRGKKSDLIYLLHGIYDKWEIDDKPAWNSIANIAHSRFVNKKGEQYNVDMKYKPSYKGINRNVEDFIATL